MFGFEKLEVWQHAIDFSDDVYRVKRMFPSEERFGLISQLRRAAVSIAANLAEGSSRQSNRDFLRFVEISFGSLMECVSHLKIAQRQNMVDDETHRNLYESCEKLSRMLSGLRNSLLRS